MICLRFDFVCYFGLFAIIGLCLWFTFLLFLVGFIVWICLYLVFGVGRGRICVVGFGC